MNTLSIIQIVLSVVMIGLILLQRPANDSGALSGGETSSGHVKRGVEKTIYYITLVVAVLFVLTSAAPLFLN